MILYKNGGLGLLLSHPEGGRGVVDQYACVPLIGSIFLISFAIAAIFSKGRLIGRATGSRDVFFLVIFVVIHCGSASSLMEEFPYQ